jgi:hypothetical protein
MALVLAFGLLPGGAFAAGGFEPQMARLTSGGGWVDRSGFSELIYHSILEGSAVGVEIGIALSDFDTPATSTRIALGSVIGGAAGLAVPLLLATGEVRSGDVVFMGVAQGLGMANGLLIPLTVQFGQCSALGGASCTFVFGVTATRIDFALSAGLSLAAGAATLLVNRQLNFSPGQAEAIGGGAIWGALIGVMIGIGLPPSAQFSPAVYTGLAIGGADAGALAAFLLRDFFDMDRSRIWFMNTGFLAGAGVGFALAFFINPSFDNLSVLSISTIAGSAAGWGVAYLATGGLDGFRDGAPSDKLGAVTLGTPSVRPLAQVVRGERSTGFQVDLLQGRF